MCDRLFSEFELYELEMVRCKNGNKSCFKHKNLNNANPKIGMNGMKMSRCVPA